jgi:hypothetical protein
MVIDDVSVYEGDGVVDLYLGYGVISKLTATGAYVRFQGVGEHHYENGGWLSGQKRLGFTRKTFISIPIGKEELVKKLLAVADITINEGF